MKTYFVTVEKCWEDVEVEAENEEDAIKEANEVIKRGWIMPSWIDEKAVEE